MTTLLKVYGYNDYPFEFFSTLKIGMKEQNIFESILRYPF